MATIEPLILECKRQEESCQYTAAAFYHWLGSAIWQNRLWSAVPIVCGAFASFAFFQQSYPILAALLALLAGVLPAIFDKLKFEAQTSEIASQAGQYKNLENRFRQAAEIVALDGPDALKLELATLMRQIEELRARPLVIPTRHFEASRKQIKAGHYRPDRQTIASAKATVKSIAPEET